MSTHSISVRLQTHKSGRTTAYVECCWKTGTNRQAHSAYSVAKHGLLGAITKVIEARERSQGRALNINARSVLAKLAPKLKGLA